MFGYDIYFGNFTDKYSILYHEMETINIFYISYVSWPWTLSREFQCLSMHAILIKSEI